MTKSIVGLGVIFSLILLVLNNFAGTLPYDIGEGYCDLRHPQEAITSSRHTCEKQHIIQQQSKGGNIENIIFINTNEHDYLDRSALKPWENNRPWLDLWADDNLESAYMMGMYANGFHFQVYDYNKRNSATTLLKWDGASHAVYLVASISNFIAKSMHYTSYQFRAENPMFIDAIAGILVDFVELIIGVAYGMVGVIVGTIWNPIDTFVNLIPATLLIAESVFKGLINTPTGALSLITLGSVSWIL